MPRTINLAGGVRYIQCVPKLASTAVCSKCGDMLDRISNLKKHVGHNHNNRIVRHH